MTGPEGRYLPRRGAAAGGARVAGSGAARRGRGAPQGRRGARHRVTKPAGGSSEQAATGVLTLGVEEEFVLVDAVTGQVALAAPEVLRLLDGAPWAKPELMRFQLETITSVCTSLDEIRAELAAHRRAAARAAARLGCRLLASGTAPYGTPGLRALTDDGRYRELARRFPALVPVAGTCACHVHVGVPSRDVGTQVLARLRPWLGSLLAISANSPISDGRDTGWSSGRYPLWSRWPTMRPPAAWSTADQYDAAVGELLRKGAALDERGVYLHARLSPRYPTVEVRVADTCLCVDDTVLLAGLVRAMVATAVDQTRRGIPVEAAPTWSVMAAVMTAARHGMSGSCADPLRGGVVTHGELVGRLAGRVADALEIQGDRGRVDALLRRLAAAGTGADRQRALWARAASPGEFTEALARATLADIGDHVVGGGQHG